MGVSKTKVFKNADGLAIQLPDDLGPDEEMTVSIKANGNGVNITPVKILDPVEEKPCI